MTSTYSSKSGLVENISYNAIKSLLDASVSLVSNLRALSMGCFKMIGRFLIVSSTSLIKSGLFRL